jgi:hypothetical protein
MIMTRQTKHICTALSLIATTLPCLLPQSILAASISDKALEEIQVVGSIITLNDKPQSATEGFVSDDHQALRLASRPAELLEFVSGLIATQHSGEGKGNQYFLRGFNLDHGTDLALKIDGLPVNMPSHAHGQGYADINFLIPELVESPTYRKEPYYAEIGDFGTAGSSKFHYVGYLYRPRSAEIGIHKTTIPKTRIAVSMFSLSLDSELFYLSRFSYKFLTPRKWLRETKMPVIANAKTGIGINLLSI